jgi:hypothetical protein
LARKPPTYNIQPVEHALKSVSPTVPSFTVSTSYHGGLRDDCTVEVANEVSLLSDYIMSWSDNPKMDSSSESYIFDHTHALLYASEYKADSRVMS